MNFVVWHNKGRATQHRLLVTIEDVYQRAYRSKQADAPVFSGNPEPGGYDENQGGKNQVVTMAMIQFLPGEYKAGFAFQNLVEYDMQDKGKAEKLALRRAIAAIMATFRTARQGFNFMDSVAALGKMLGEKSLPDFIVDEIEVTVDKILKTLWFPDDSRAELEAL
jgi:hypothetical protein